MFKTPWVDDNLVKVIIPDNITAEDLAKNAEDYLYFIKGPIKAQLVVDADKWRSALDIVRATKRDKRDNVGTKNA